LRESDRADPVRERELQALPVTGGEELRLTARPAVPDGADGVDHVFRRQAIAAGDLRVAGRAAAERAALAQQLRARRAMDGAVDPPPPPSRVVLAALTIASTASPVMSASMARSRTDI